MKSKILSGVSVGIFILLALSAEGWGSLIANAII